MINNLQISGVHSQLNKDITAYIKKKIGGLDKYIPKKARESTFVEVKLKEMKAKDKQSFVCEVIMKLPKGNITAHKNSTSALSAIDEVENNMKIQLKKYKDLHTQSRLRRHLESRFKGSVPADNLL